MAALASSATCLTSLSLSAGTSSSNAVLSCKNTQMKGLSSVRSTGFSSFLNVFSRQKNTPKTSNVTVCKVSVGDTVPAVTLKDQDGRNFSLSKLKGRNVVLYFYPQAETPGCTKQACSFRDSYTEFKKLGAEVVGVSSDSSEALKAFKTKYNLPYTLLSDEGSAVRKEFGIPGDLFGVLPGRQTYVIDKKGIVKLIFNNQFQPEKHIGKTLEVLSA